MINNKLYKFIIRVVSRCLIFNKFRTKFEHLFLDKRYSNHAQNMGVNIGKHSYLGKGCWVYHPDSKIGSFCVIAHNVLIGAGQHPLNYLSVHPFQYSHNYIVKNKKFKLFESYHPVKIGNDVWIGSNVTIMDRVIIGDGAVIGSNAVVTKDVPPYAIIVGVPAKIIRYRFDNNTIKELLELKWWDLDDAQLINIPYDNIDACIKQLKKIKG